MFDLAQFHHYNSYYYTIKLYFDWNAYTFFPFESQPMVFFVIFKECDVLAFYSTHDSFVETTTEKHRHFNWLHLKKKTFSVLFFP